MTETHLARVSPGYFHTLDIPIVQGRAFTCDDTETGPLLAILDDTAARRYWPGKNPLGSI